MSPAVRQWFESTRLNSACGTVKYEPDNRPHYVSADPELGEVDKGPANPVDAFAALAPAERTETWLALDQGQRNGLWSQLNARGQLALITESGLK